MKKIMSEKEASFIAIYAKNYQPWLKVPKINEENRTKKVDIVLMVNRWDGMVGFPGGLVEKGEDTKISAIRETIEEINYQVNSDKLKFFCAHNLKEKKLTTHLYGIEVSIEEIFKIQQNIFSAVDYGSEIMGSNLVILNNLHITKGFQKFIESPMPESVKEELLFIKKVIKTN